MPRMGSVNKKGQSVGKYTIADVMSELVFVKERVEATHNLAVKTNGRVTNLEGKLIAKKAVDDYKASQGRNNWAIFAIFATLAGPLVGVIAAKVFG